MLSRMIYLHFVTNLTKGEVEIPDNDDNREALRPKITK